MKRLLNAMERLINYCQHQIDLCERGDKDALWSSGFLNLTVISAVAILIVLLWWWLT